MLACAGHAERHVQLGGDDLTGRTDEAFGRQPAAIRRDPGAAQCRADVVGQLLHQRHAVRPAGAETAGDDPFGLVQGHGAGVGGQGPQSPVAETGGIERRMYDGDFGGATGPGRIHPPHAGREHGADQGGIGPNQSFLTGAAVGVTDHFRVTVADDADAHTATDQRQPPAHRQPG